MIPAKLKKGAHVRVIAPARSLGIVSGECRRIACERLAEMGLSVSFGRHAEETDEFCSSSAAARLEDLHEAFADRTVDGILTVIGGFNSVEILAGIDYRLIAENPKIFCGFSDITALLNAVYAKTGLVTFSGPHFSSLGMLKGIDYTLQNMKKTVFFPTFFPKATLHLCTTRWMHRFCSSMLSMNTSKPPAIMNFCRNASHL